MNPYHHSILKIQILAERTFGHYKLFKDVQSFIRSIESDRAETIQET